MSPEKSVTSNIDVLDLSPNDLSPNDLSPGMGGSGEENDTDGDDSDIGNAYYDHFSDDDILHDEYFDDSREKSPVKAEDTDAVPVPLLTRDNLGNYIFNVAEVPIRENLENYNFSDKGCRGFT